MVSLLAARAWCLVYKLILVLLGNKKKIFKIRRADNRYLGKSAHRCLEKLVWVLITEANGILDLFKKKQNKKKKPVKLYDGGR